MSRELKIEAARAACDYVENGMKLGIGTGSTAEEFIRLLAEKVTNGLDVIGVPTSERSRELCEELGVKVTTLDELPHLDLTVDGADEVDDALDLIKGGGAALLREKIVAAASDKMIVIVDESKMVGTLGAFPLPIEVNPFGLKATELAIAATLSKLSYNCPIKLRMNGDDIVQTDGGHYIIDASFGHIRDARRLSEELLNIPGVVQHGLFLDMANIVVVAAADGIKTVKRK